MNIKRVILIVIDACGVGELPDADQYGDVGSSTIPNLAEAVGGLDMPTCQSMGLGNIVPIKGVSPTDNPIAFYGKMAEKSAGKDSTTGHWEIVGIQLEKPFPVFPDGFPDEIVKEFESKAEIETIGNVAASGTEIIERLGEEHLATKKIILYTSADSVFQLAAHEDLYPIEKQYEICQIARDLLVGDYSVSRVIARPFVGTVTDFERTTRRKDFSIEPTKPTLLDLLTSNSIKVLSIGKIYDLFAGRGIAKSIKTTDNKHGLDEIEKAILTDNEHKLIFANLVDFDQLWGHRNNEKEFAKSLEQFDRRLPTILKSLKVDDLLIITADHGCDPTIKTSTDHSREYVPLLVYNRSFDNCKSLGTRESFTDLAKTIADCFNIDNNFPGYSFFKTISESN